MARKRNKKKRLNSFVVSAPLAGVAVLLTVVALAYVGLDCRCETLGREIKALERQRDALRKKYLTEEYKWTRLKSPKSLELALQKFNIQMSWPKSEQVIRFADDSSKDLKKYPILSNKVVTRNE